jgi:LuxR family transcriptional regulator, glucitol operon activator
MSGTLQRRTLYALLSELETDLRDIIRNELLPALGANLLSDGEHRRAYDRFCKDQRVSSQDISVADLLEYLDPADGAMIINRYQSVFSKNVQQILKKSCDDLQGLIPTRNRVMHALPLEFDDFSKIFEFCKNITRMLR